MKAQVRIITCLRLAFLLMLGFAILSCNSHCISTGSINVPGDDHGQTREILAVDIPSELHRISQIDDPEVYRASVRNIASRCGQDKLMLCQVTSVIASSDWQVIECAADALDTIGEASIPGLIRLLDDNRQVPLINTNDLLYPDADELTSHGGIVPFHLNTVACRAAWILERIVYVDSGYRCVAFTEPSIIVTLIQSSNIKQTPATIPCTCDLHGRSMSHAFMLRWYHLQDQLSPGRFERLIAALKSGERHRQSLAIQYLRFDELTAPSIRESTLQKNQLQYELAPLCKSKHEALAQQARLLLTSMCDW